MIASELMCPIFDLGRTPALAASKEQRHRKVFHLHFLPLARLLLPALQSVDHLEGKVMVGIAVQEDWICSVLSNTKLYFSSFATAVDGRFDLLPDRVNDLLGLAGKLAVLAEFLGTVLVRLPLQVYQFLLLRLLRASFIMASFFW